MSIDPYHSPESEVFYEPLKPAPKFSQSALFAFFVTPWLGIACSLVVLILWLVPGFRNIIESDSVGILQGANQSYTNALAVVLFYGLAYSIVTYPILLIYGVPVHFLLNKFKVKTPLAYISLGALPGCILFPFLLPFMFTSSRNYALSYIVFGGIVAYTFWFICVRPVTGLNKNA